MSHSGWVALWVTWAPGFWKRRKRLGIEKGVISCSAESIFDYLLVTHFQNLGTTLPKMQLTLALHSYNTVGQFRNRQKQFSRTRDIMFLYFHILYFKTLSSTFTHNAPRATEWHHWRELIRLDAVFSWATNDFTLPDYLTYSHLCPSDGHMQKKTFCPAWRAIQYVWKCK